jgi:hypothetical protein
VVTVLLVLIYLNVWRCTELQTLNLKKDLSFLPSFHYKKLRGNNLNTYVLINTVIARISGFKQVSC